MLTQITLALACIALAGDVLSTARDIRNGGSERWPSTRWLMSKFGMWPTLLVTHIGYALFLAVVGFWWCNLGVTVAFGYATFHNLSQTGGRQ